MLSGEHVGRGLELAHGDGRFPRLFRSLVKVDLLILDDWGPDRLTELRHHLSARTSTARRARKPNGRHSPPGSVEVTVVLNRAGSGT